MQPVPMLFAGGHQPYSPLGGRQPGLALEMMKRGAPAFAPNPMDMQRQIQTLAAGRGPAAAQRPMRAPSPTLLDMLRNG